MKNPYIACSFFQVLSNPPVIALIAPNMKCYFNNIMDMHMLSLGILIPEGPSYVFYATRDQIYWGLRHIFFYLTSRIKCSNFSMLKILFNIFQIKRLDLCQKLLVSLKMTGYLNDNALSLQCIVQIYGLLCPIIYWQLPVSPVLQVKYFSN